MKCVAYMTYKKNSKSTINIRFMKLYNNKNGIQKVDKSRNKRHQKKNLFK